MSQGPAGFIALHNGGTVSFTALPVLAPDALCAGISDALEQGMRIASYFAMVPGPHGTELIAVLAHDRQATLHAGRALVKGKEFPSLTPRHPQAHLFEREIAEQSGLHPNGHPWLKPVRFAPSLNPKGGPTPPGIGDVQFFAVTGDAIHEVAVGPVHAGVIEPGHFRFQCYGERVLHLEISLGYQHRGVEAALLGGPHKITARQMETVAGDTSIGHGWAYTQNMESLSKVHANARSQVVRAIALELERLANHTGDLGAIAGDVAYLPTQSYCGRIRGDFLNMTALLCGNRFGRNLLAAGRNRFDIDSAMAEELLKRLETAERDVTEAVDLMWNAPSVLGRFENVGKVTLEQCLEIGMVGPAARACGLERDVRSDHPLGVYQFTNIPTVTAHHGDVNSRVFVRWLEMQRSLAFLKERITALEAASELEPPHRRRAPAATLAPDRLACALIEGWRGEICHVAVTDASGGLARYKITDPSFHNWMGLALALRDQEISDFPLCNKSFNLSYCGFDL